MGWDYVSVELRSLTDTLSNLQIIHEWTWSIGGIMLTGENRLALRKTCPSTTLSTTNPTWAALTANPGLRGEKPPVLWHGPTYDFPPWPWTCLKCNNASAFYSEVLGFESLLLTLVIPVKFRDSNITYFTIASSRIPSNSCLIASLSCTSNAT
jgi:hypothetical protein